MTIIIQAVESGGKAVVRKFPAIGFAGKKSPDLVFLNVDRYGLGGHSPDLQMCAHKLIFKWL